ncbi:MAG: pyridoxamine 5'-phosphate oxidase family protein [Sedimentisphaerales bacterium]|nr:pyridoxamine 5'-phosphate oxidase family protein [Sedimentisphaerales bacterium]
MPSTSNPVSAVTDFLIKSQVQYLATIGLDDKPKVRPFQFMLEEGGRLHFCTSNQKPVFKEMQEHPYVEFCASGADFSWLRLSGKAVFSKDLGLKARILEASPLVKSIYKAADNPAFEIFYVDEAVATSADFSGNPPMTFRL